MKIVVVGRGPFPLDMLRYDQCCPATSEDAGAIHYSGLDRASRDKRVVTLNSMRRVAPTFGRWESFGWTVISHDPMTLRERDSDEVADYADLLTRS